MLVDLFYSQYQFLCDFTAVFRFHQFNAKFQMSFRGNELLPQFELFRQNSPCSQLNRRMWIQELCSFATQMVSLARSVKETVSLEMCVGSLKQSGLEVGGLNPF